MMVRCQTSALFLLNEMLILYWVNFQQKILFQQQNQSTVLQYHIFFLSFYFDFVIQMLYCSNVQLFKCSIVQMFYCSIVLLFKCSNVLLFKCSIVQIFKCSNVLLFKCSIVQIFYQKFLFSFTQSLIKSATTFEFVPGGNISPTPAFFNSIIS